MIRIVFAVILLIFLYLLILSIYHIIKKSKKENIDIFNKFEQHEDTDINHIYNSSINFDDILIKDRHYLNTFIDEINPNLPKMQRLGKEIVEVKSYLFNKKYDNKGSK